jgi:hypothetical protein
MPLFVPHGVLQFIKVLPRATPPILGHDWLFITFKNLGTLAPSSLGSTTRASHDLLLE